MELAGLVLAGIGLLFLLALAFRGAGAALPEGIKRSRGILLHTSGAGHSEKGSLTVRYTAGKETHTTSFKTNEADLYFPGQQVLVDYDPRRASEILQVHSVSAAMGKRFLGMLVAALFIIGGLLLIRLA